MKAVTVAWLAVAVAASAMGPHLGLGLRLVAATLGAGAAAGMVALWGQRTRPSSTWRWNLSAAVAVVLGLVLPPWLAAGIGAFAIALFLLHDHPAGPAVVLLAGMAVLMRQPSGTWRTAGTVEAWWLAIAATALVVAALVERDRLAAATTPVAPSASVARVVWIVLWTLVLVALQDVLHVAPLFQAIGVDVARTSGRIALLSVLVLATALAGLLLRSKEA